MVLPARTGFGFESNARLFRLTATSGCSGPSAFSQIATLPLPAEEVAAKFMRYARGWVPHEKSFVFANATLASEVDVKMRALWDLLF